MKIGKVLFYVHDICEFEEIENDPDKAWLFICRN